MLTSRSVLFLTSAALLATPILRAAETTISSTETVAQTLTASDTLTLSGAGKVSVGGTTVGVAITGSGSAVLNNNGVIENTGTGRAVRIDVTSQNATITNTGMISTVSADTIQVSKDSAVALTNSGTIQVTNGGQALDFTAITSKANSITNAVGGTISAGGEDAIRTGVNGVVVNHGQISATSIIEAEDKAGDPRIGHLNASGSDGIDLRGNAGANITNHGTIEGRHGITGEPTVAPAAGIWLTVTNGTESDNASAIISGKNGSGLNIDGLHATMITAVTNHGVIQGRWDGQSQDGDGDGVDVDGVAQIVNHGVIRALSSAGIGSDGLTNTADGIAIGGGSVDNKAGATITSVGRGILVDNSSQGNALTAFTLTNAGMIAADNGAAVGIVGAFANTITNSAGGSITGGNATQAVISLGSGNDTVNNAGSISTGNGATVALSLGAGDDTLNITGGSITGDIDGGEGSDTIAYDVGEGKTYTTSSVVRNVEVVTIASGTVVIANADALSTASVTVNGGVLNLADHAITNTITLSGGKLVGASQATGEINFTGNVAVSGTVSASLNTGASPTRAIDVTGGLTIAQGATLSGQGLFSGGLVTVAGTHAVGNSPGRQTFANGLSYEAGAIVEWEFSGDTLTTRGTDFDAIDITGGDFTAAPGATLKIVNFSAIDYTDALWDLDRSFLIFDATGANSMNATFVFDTSAAGDFSGQGAWALDYTATGVSASWTAVPEPSTYGLAGAGALALAAAARRRRKA